MTNFKRVLMAEIEEKMEYLEVLDLKGLVEMYINKEFANYDGEQEYLHIVTDYFEDEQEEYFLDNPNGFIFSLDKIKYFIKLKESVIEDFLNAQIKFEEKDEDNVYEIYIDNISIPVNKLIKLEKELEDQIDTNSFKEKKKKNKKILEFLGF